MATLVSERFGLTSTDVVKQLLPMGDIFSEVVLLLQEETTFWLVESNLRTSEYRPINIFVNFYSDPEFKFKVPRAKFFPQPNVDAAVVSFKLKQPTQYPAVSSTKSFFSMVNSAFNGKHKMLRKSLQHICSPSDIESALDNVGRPATSRPEELTTMQGNRCGSGSAKLASTIPRKVSVPIWARFPRRVRYTIPRFFIDLVTEYTSDSEPSVHPSIAVKYCDNSNSILVGFPDAGYLSHPYRGISQTGYVFTMGNETIS